MFNRKPQSDADFLKEWENLRKNKATYILVKGIISYGLVLGFAVALLLFLSKGIDADPMKVLQILLIFSLFGMIRAWIRFQFFEKQYQKLKETQEDEAS